MNSASSTNVKNNLNNEAMKLAELLHNFCYISSNENDITLNFKSLKVINKQLSNDFLLEHLIKIVDLILNLNPMSANIASTFYVLAQKK